MKKRDADLGPDLQGSALMGRGKSALKDAHTLTTPSPGEKPGPLPLNLKETARP